MSSDFIKCVNPATLEEIGEVPITPASKVVELVTKARAAHPLWARTSFKRRAEYMLKVRRYLLGNIDSFAEVITRDNGKPLVESLSAEIYPIADLIYYFAHNAERILKKRRISVGIWGLLARCSVLTYQPYGVIGIISPWNYPFSIPVGAIVMALMAGNCVLLKPSSATALVGQKIAELMNAAGLPEHTFTHLPGDSRTGQSLLESPVHKIIFTGSTHIGHQVMNVCSRRLTPCSLELGGKDPMIVLKDANLKHAANAAVWGAFTNAGQCCASVERVYVHEKIAAKFVEMVVEKTAQLKIGIGTEPDTDVGPLTTEAQLKTVEAHVEDARTRGGKILIGGERVPNLGGYFYRPTVISHVDHSFDCVHEETFGPLMPIMTFRNEDQVIRLANDTPYGLNAYIWTKNKRRGREIAAKIRCGTVAINECVYTHALPQTPWGGVKASGFGRAHGRAGLLELVNLHHIHTNYITFLKDVWWYKYNARLLGTFKKLARDMTGGLWGKIKALPRFMSLLRKVD